MSSRDKFALACNICTVVTIGASIISRMMVNRELKRNKEYFKEMFIKMQQNEKREG